MYELYIVYGKYKVYSESYSNLMLFIPYLTLLETETLL